MGALHQNKWCETEWLGSQPRSGPYKVRVCVCPVQCALGSIKLHNANGFGKDKCPLDSALVVVVYWGEEACAGRKPVESAATRPVENAKGQPSELRLLCSARCHCYSNSISCIIASGSRGSIVVFTADKAAESSSAISGSRRTWCFVLVRHRRLGSGISHNSIQLRERKVVRSFPIHSGRRALRTRCP